MNKSTASNQVGGHHYKNMVIDPTTYIVENNIGWLEGNVIKYVSRWKNKGGVQDLEKARHYLDIIIKKELDRQEKARQQDRAPTHLSYLP